MSMYPTGDLPARPSVTARPRYRLIGVSHRSAKMARRLARAAIENALDILQSDAGRQPSRLTPDAVGSAIIDRIDELDPAALHALEVAFSALLRTSRGW
jgi:hypothetical protein